MSDESLSCGDPIANAPERAQEPTRTQEDQKVKDVMTTARVGKKAPDFSAQAYFAGAFAKISLSDYAGKWVMVCFYPGDFTFV